MRKRDVTVKMITVCPNCKAVYSVPAKDIGRVIQCKCKRPIRLGAK